MEWHAAALQVRSYLPARSALPAPLCSLDTGRLNPETYRLFNNAWLPKPHQHV